MNEKYVLSEVMRVIDGDERCRELFSPEQLTQYRLIAERLAAHESARPFRVVFCGVFSSGKTSLINAVLDAGYSLPQGVNPVTKLVTRIRGGSGVTCAYRLNGREVPVSTHYLTELIQGKKQLVCGSNELIVTLPSEKLPPGVELIDTPGFNDEMGGELEQMTRSAIYEADMAVVCCNSLQLGKIVERNLLQDLDSLLGHYALVVTRMDNLNTQEDWENVMAQANRLMRNRGDDAAIFPGEPCYVFPVAAAGAMQNIRSFDGYLRAILSDGDIRSRIREVSDRKCLRLCLCEIRPALEGLARETQTELSALTRENRAAQRRQEQEADIRRNRLLGAMAGARYTAVQMADARMNALAQELRCIPRPEIFQLEANQLTRTAVMALIEDIAVYSEKQHIAGIGEVRPMLEYAYERQGFTVPPPYKTRARVRNFPRRLLRTAWNFLTFRFRLDDGCEEVYADYVTPAIQIIREGAMASVCRQWEAYLDQLYSGIRTKGFEGGQEALIGQKQSSLRCYEDVLGKIRAAEANGNAADA